MREETNGDLWLQSNSKSKVLALAVKEYVTDVSSLVVDKEAGVEDFFKQKHYENLKLLFTVFSRDEDTFAQIINKMTPYIMEIGRKIVDSEDNLKDPVMFTEKLLTFKSEIDQMVSMSFNNQIIF